MLLIAIIQSVKGYVAMNRRKILTGAILIVLAVVGWSGVRWIRDARERAREQGREEERQQLRSEEQQLRQSANQSAIRAEELDRQNKRLEAENAGLRRQARVLSRQRREVRRKYEQKVSEFESITDYRELRRRNCLERARLGFPCPEQ